MNYINFETTTDQIRARFGKKRGLPPMKDEDKTIGPEILAIIMQGKARDSAMAAGCIDRLEAENARLRKERDHYQQVAEAYSDAITLIEHARGLERTYRMREGY